jgi:hypothetical protein
VGTLRASRLLAELSLTLASFASWGGELCALRVAPVAHRNRQSAAERAKSTAREHACAWRVHCARMATRPLLLGWLVSRASQLRFPKLFALTAVLFALDFVVPDLVPFADEILLGLATALLGSWRKRKAGPPSPGRSSAT